MKKRPIMKKKSTALAVVKRSHHKPVTRAVLVRRPTPATPTSLAVPRMLTDDVSLGELGLVGVKLTDAEEAVLVAPVDPHDIDVLPTGQPYLSHPWYTRRFNQAFGRTGWQIIPVAKPMMNEKSVVCPYILFVHQKPVAFAMGEQAYHPTNKDQTYGDALEATIASALRRCAKRIGVGLEMWDRRFLRKWIDEFAVKVWLEKKDGDTNNKPVFRRRDEPPFWNEKGQGQGQGDGGRAHRQTFTAPPKTEAPPPVYQHSTSDGLITLAQRQRLVTIAHKHHRTDLEVKMWLSIKYHLDSTAQISKRLYDDICTALEAPGPLPLPEEREPGSDG